MRKYLLTQKIELPSPWPVALRQDLLIQCSSDFFSSVVAWRREEWSIRSSFASRLSVTASVLEDFDVHKRWRKQAWIGKGEFNGRILLQYSFFTLWGSSHCESPAFPHLVSQEYKRDSALWIVSLTNVYAVDFFIPLQTFFCDKMPFASAKGRNCLGGIVLPVFQTLALIVFDRAIWLPFRKAAQHAPSALFIYYYYFRCTHRQVGNLPMLNLCSSLQFSVNLSWTDLDWSLALREISRQGYSRGNSVEFRLQLICVSYSTLGPWALSSIWSVAPLATESVHLKITPAHWSE